MKSWKTTLSGIGVILSGAGAAIKFAVAGDYGTAIATLIPAVSAGIGLIAARDNNVTSEQAGAK